MKESVVLSFDVINPNTIICDRNKFINIMKQVVSNSINYTEEGFIKVSCTDESIDNIKFSEIYKKTLIHKEYIVVKVWDSGVGIPIDQNEMIYESFRKVESYTLKLFRGIGLGLSISKRLVEIMGGGIWNQSKTPGGTIFYFAIPYIHG